MNLFPKVLKRLRAACRIPESIYTRSQRSKTCLKEICQELWFFLYLNWQRLRSAFLMKRQKSSASVIVHSESCQLDVRKLLRFGEMSDVLVLVLFSPSGVLTELQENLVNAYSEAGYDVVLVVNTNRMDHVSDSLGEKVKVFVIRENIGFDFGAWRDAIHLLKDLNGLSSISFTNDSILPIDDLGSLKGRVSRSSADVVFCTQSFEQREHMQSYFFSVTRSGILKGGANLISTVPYYRHKQDLINQVELSFSSTLALMGFSSECLFHVNEAELTLKNPTIWFWRDLIGVGFPFLKIQLFTPWVSCWRRVGLQKVLSAHKLQMVHNHLNSRAG